ncbi:MAG: LPS export ABC transporter permease LptG [Deltaproteobacteria bacterium GWC2_42_51]|nr:MAG: LPS export ABC transporter permease LptG [Deltaproteobacteria bacterium GWA2_42_85]OGP32883.1 MAG: LPS export ABC transporter permease LptG [Deltaproteobacteria bacterium GWC2_42_51]OGP40710.1 MAG: LPS export ABC transporter permease LptG [Deltaproteobacteria bacterium GWD2_42_10]OGP47275.1 MAG: LPS export ABC transporter permease LptG [Deltaproteobacteria bacterium GWF2_42_12]OGQ25181.1 MAG: LPS export ABC transporter permease LptG [Deltaproteobacteria bacterium RIFCSPHIGHO2_02_FULL_42
MRILTRYIIKEFLKIFILTITAFISLYLIIDVFEQMDTLIEYRVQLKDGLYFFLYKIPFIFYQLSPIAVLMATLITIGILSRYSEVIAALASGISVLMFSLPFFIFAIFISVVNFTLSESVVPYTTQRVAAMKQAFEGSNKTVFAQDSIWFKDNTDIYNISYIEPEAGILKGFTVYRMDSNFNISSRIDAKLVNWKDGKWISPEGILSQFQDSQLLGVSTLKDAAMPLSKKPDELRNIERLANEMNYRELTKYVKKLKREGYAASRYSVDLHSKISFPLVSIIMVMIGIPFALRSGRHGGIAIGVGLSVIIGFSYWVVFAVNSSLGYNSIIPPFVAAWFTNFIFTGFGVLLLNNIRQ